MTDTAFAPYRVTSTRVPSGVAASRPANGSGTHCRTPGHDAARATPGRRGRPAGLSRWCVLGELGLDGRVHGARGALPIAAAASRAALGALMVPAVNAPSSLAAKISVARATCIRPRGSDVALSTMENPRTCRELRRDDTRLHRRPSTSADRIGTASNPASALSQTKQNRGNVSCNRDLPWCPRARAVFG